MSQTDVPARERFVAGEAIDWEADATRGIVKFSPAEHAPLAPITPHAIRSLRDHGEPVSTAAPGHDIDDLLEWGDRLEAAAGDGGGVGFGGFITREGHHNHPLVHIDSLIAEPGDAGAFDAELQLAFVKEFRFADELTAEDDCLYIWFD